MAQAKGLGKGISALLEDDGEVIVKARADGGAATVAVGSIQPGRFQPRRHFEESALQELADSIAVHGVMQPLVLRAVGEAMYEIVAGERRWRAAQKAGLTEIPAIVRELSDDQALELALIENIQRQDLNPLEEAQGYQRLIDEFGYTHETLAKAVGKSRSHVTNLLRLLGLPEKVKHYLDEGKLRMAHARALLTTQQPEILAEFIVDGGLSVRQAEQLARGEKGVTSNPMMVGLIPDHLMELDTAPKRTAAPKEKTRAAKDEDIVALEQTLSDNIGLRVEINDRGQRGEVVIAYDSLDQLDDILRRLGGVA